MKLNNLNNKKNNWLNIILMFLFSLSVLAFSSCDLEENDADTEETEEDHFDESLDEAITHFEEDPTAKTAGSDFSNAVVLEKSHTRYDVTLIGNSDDTYSGHCQFEATGEELLIVFSSDIEHEIYDSTKTNKIDSEKSGEKDEYNYSVFHLEVDANYYLYFPSANLDSVSLVKEYLEEEGHDHDDHDH